MTQHSKLFDYIIIGAGSAGCVLAERLSVSGRFTVLLIEEGPANSGFIVTMPKGFGKLLFNDTVVSRFATEPESGTGDRSESWPAGAMVGGSSAINGMFYTRGHPQDYDDWAATGLTDWSWQHIRRSFVAIEDHALGSATDRGVGGPLHISINPIHNPLCEATIRAGAEVGLSSSDDINEDPNSVIGYAPLTIKAGRRVSAAKAFLDPALKRQNLTLVTKTLVTGIVFDGKRARQVKCRTKSGEMIYEARREIILSAGSLQSPKLLQLSGVGPASLLGSFGIPVIVDAPHVGTNLREHRMLSAQFRVNGSDSLNGQFSGIKLLANLVHYVTTRRGHMATGSHDVIAFVKSDETQRRPDIELVMAPFSIDVTAQGLAFERTPGIQFFGYQLRPESQGTVMIKSPDIDVKPEIRPQYLTAEVDRHMSFSILRAIRTLASAPALNRYIEVETLPGALVSSETDAIAYHQRYGAPVNHVSGTCRMGNDNRSVVDGRARVRGVDGLRVVDCSIMPTLISGHTNGPVMAMAWRAAELILEDSGF